MTRGLKRGDQAKRSFGVALISTDRCPYRKERLRSSESGLHRGQGCEEDLGEPGNLQRKERPRTGLTAEGNHCPYQLPVSRVVGSEFSVLSQKSKHNRL